PHVAASAAGIPDFVFEEWLRLGDPTGRPSSWHVHKLYTPFWVGVRQAQAQARLVAEMAALKDDPLGWLRYGPGKDRPDSAGWSTPVRQLTFQDNRSVNLLLAPEFLGILSDIL